ncbi:MAG: TIGR03790 family protein [Opitutales bacterium]|nr:TIGR03790 family protein [Opitutales bacterium]MCH8540148.1 TIGR03790 family protein [Opitutales bacterium]
MSRGGDPSRVVVLVNSEDRDSRRVAKFYREHRGIPEENFIALPMSSAETVGWETFWEEIFHPLQGELIDRGWISGRKVSGEAETGQVRHQVRGHRMAFLVTTRGVPLRIRHEDDLLTEEDRQRLPEAQQTNRAAVDQILSLLAAGRFPLNGPLPNPYFQQAEPSSQALSQIVRVARLDGPTVRSVEGMLTSALEAEENGLRGRAYIDLADGRPHPAGDQWLKASAEKLEAHHFDLTIDEAREVFPPLARFDAPVWYFGWYTRRMSGPFALAGFEFAPGAIGFHIHSFSAATVRSRDREWVGPLIGKGIAATVGNVWEPFLEISHRPDLLVEGFLEKEMSFGEAAWYAMPAVGWQGVVLGDPLYQPMLVSLEEQVENLGEAGSSSYDHYDQYVVLRELNRRLAEGKDRDSVLDWGAQAFLDRPGIALAWRLARKGDTEDWPENLRFLQYLTFIRDRELGLVMEIADHFHEQGHASEAFTLYEKLVGRTDLSAAPRKEILEKAIALARSLYKREHLLRWQPLLEELQGE